MTDYFRCLECGSQTLLPNEACCDVHKYRVGAEICCENQVVFPVAEGDVHYYNEDYMCCKGIHLWPLSGKEIACCGGTPYDMETQGCCEEVVYDASKQGCCNGLIYATQEEYCCGDRLFLTENKVGDIYFSESWMCCQQSYPRLRDNYDACCQREPYATATQLCCADGSVQERSQVEFPTVRTIQARDAGDTNPSC